MENNTSNHTLPVAAPEENDFNIKEIIYRFLRDWHWFVLAIIVCMSLALLYIRYTAPVYKVSSKILIKNDTKTGGTEGITQNNIINELSLFNNQSPVGDEAEVLKTRYIMRRVVEELHLNVSYFAVGKIKSTDLYTKSPFYVDIVTMNDSLPLKKFLFQLNKTSFSIENDSSKTVYNYNDTVKTPNLSFVVKLRPGMGINYSGDYLLTINSIDASVDAYLNNITTEIVSKQTDVIQQTLEITIPKKGEDI